MPIVVNFAQKGNVQDVRGVDMLGTVTKNAGSVTQRGEWTSRENEESFLFTDSIFHHRLHQPRILQAESKRGAGCGNP